MPKTSTLTKPHKLATKPCTSVTGSHHWLIEPWEPGTGGILGGACKHCGATKTFNPTTIERSWREYVQKGGAE